MPPLGGPCDSKRAIDPRNQAFPATRDAPSQPQRPGRPYPAWLEPSPGHVTVEDRPVREADGDRIPDTHELLYVALAGQVRELVRVGDADHDGVHLRHDLGP